MSTVSGPYDMRGCLRRQTANIERWWHRVYGSIDKVLGKPHGREVSGGRGEEFWVSFWALTGAFSKYYNLLSKKYHFLSAVASLNDMMF